MDVLSDLLQRSRARGAAFSRSTLYGDWSISFPPNGTLALHAIIEGDLLAWTADSPEQPVRLTGGDVVILRSTPHFMASDPSASPQPIPGASDETPARRLSIGDPEDGAEAQFFCGAYAFDGDLALPLLEPLPPIVRLRPKAGSPLRAMIDLLIAQMEDDGAGQQVVLDRLLDATLVLALRTWFAQSTDAPGWLTALDDPSVAPALRAIHALPERPWTVADLAREAHQSRSAFAQRFTESVGVPPLQYLADWRMALAKEALRDGDDSIATIARAVGYGSEFSFAAAFKRHTGSAPGGWRSANRSPHSAHGSS